MKKFIAFLLSIVLLVNTIPIQTFATEETEEITEMSSEIITPPVFEQKEAEIIGEYEEQRDENIKQFLLDDGSFQVCQYTQPVHYYNDGKWEDIDNSLLETEDSDISSQNTDTDEASTENETVIENTKNDFKIKFANKAKKSNMIRIKQEEYQISWGILDGDNKPKFEIIQDEIDTEETENPTSLKKIKSSGVYSNVFEGVDMRYTIISKTLKEDIILNNKDCENEFSFSYQLKGLGMRITDENTIELYDSNNTEKVVYVIDKPYMYDSAETPASSDAVSMELTEKNGKYTITITADKTWLAEEERVYPVVIDPTLQPDTNAHNIKDATRVVSTISDADRAVIESANEKLTMKVGYRFGSELQGLIYFNIPSVIPSSAKIINAKIAMYFYERPSSEMQINAHLITSDWNTSVIDVNTVLYGLDTPTYDSNVIDYKFFSSDTEYKYHFFDITSAVQKWSTGVCPNYGILFAPESVYTSSNYIRFVDSDHGGNYDPQYLFTYRDNKGLEDYWTYHTQDAGKAGIGYINDYSGNLVFVHNDTTTTSERMSISLDHVFDQSRLRTTGAYLTSTSPKYGNGWRLSAVQRLQQTQSESIKAIYPYYYTDADGTEHYFKSNGDGTYSDEDGLGLTLQPISQYTDNEQTYLNFSIVTKDKIVMKFDSWGFLRRITDTKYNTICFNYSPGTTTENNYLTSITDPSGRTVVLNYDSEYRLTSIRNPDGNTTTYEYNQHGQLTSITYSDGSSVLYSYDNVNCINTVKDVELTGSGRYTIDYNLHSYAPYRVASVTEYATDGQAGQSISNIVYEHNQTLFTDNQGRTSIYQFDNWGCTTSVIGSSGNASNYSYEHTGNKNNKFSTVGNSQKNITNYIMNSSAESNADWDIHTIASDGTTVSGDVLFTNEQSYIGNRSFYTNTETNSELRVAHMQDVDLQKGTYTLSAYIKTQNVYTDFNGGGALSVFYTDSAGEQKWIDSDFTIGTEEWKKVSLTFELPNETNTIQIYIGLVNASGTAYFDCVQLESGEVANNYNLLQNGSFEQINNNFPQYWTGCETTSADGMSSSIFKDEKHSLKINGFATENKYVSQIIPVTGSEGDIFSVSGWAKGSSVGLTDGTVFNITTRVAYSDGSEKWEGHNFNAYVEDWQFLSVLLSTDDKNSSTNKTYTSIGVYFCYYQNENEVYIDHFQVTKDSGQSYAYDENGNLISTIDMADEEAAFEYQNNILSKLINPDGSNYEYSYGYSSFNLMIGARTGGGVSYKFGYNMFYGFGTTDIAQTSGDKYSSNVSIGKVYYIRNRQTGKNLQPYNCGHYSGTNVVQYTPNTSQYQKWRVRDAGNGYIYLELADASTCKLSVKNGTAITNQPLELNADYTESIKFKLVANSAGIHYSIRPKLDETMAVCSNLGSTANNNQILLYPYANAGYDKEWYFVEVEQSDYVEPQIGKTYYISNHLTGQCIDGGAFYTYVGHPLTQHAYLGGTNQQFKLEAVGNYFLLVPQHCSGKVFSVESDGTNITLQEKNTSDTNQQFQMIALSNGAYRIVPRNYSNKCISQQTASAAISQSLKILDYTDELWQQWRFTEPIDYTVSAKPEDGGIYYIRFNHNYQYMDVPTMRSEDGTSLTQYPLNSMLNQQFRLTASTSGYYNIRPMHTNDNVVLTMVPDSSRTDGGGFIRLKTANGSSYQDFKFVATSNNTYRMVCRASGSDAFCVEIPNGINDFSAVVKYVPFVGSGANWQWLTLEKVGDVIRTSATYTDNKNYVTSITDETGNTTYYDYDLFSGQLNSVTDAKGNITSYIYDSSDRLSSVSSGNANVNYNYYSDSSLQKITSPSGTEYNFTYDGFGNTKTIRVGTKLLTEHFYNEKNGMLAQSNYGNGTTIKYQYDLFDYLKQKLYNDTVITDYTYDAQGRLYKKNDYLANQTLLYEYDFVDRVTSVCSSDGLKQTYNYDNKNRLEAYTSYIGELESKTEFLYGKDPVFGIDLQNAGYLYGVSLNGTQTLAYEYDSLSRLATKRIDGANYYKVGYEYYQGPNNEEISQTTTLLAAITNGDTRWEYTYDELGNITSISKDGTVQESYTYDSQNQLKTVTRGSDIWEYSYDNGGNLIEIKENGTVIKTYGYGDSEWKDLLTTYNNQTITYDAIGNPLQYRDEYNFTWENGKQLSTITNGSDAISYAYNSDGLRVSKTVNGITTEYYWLEGSLLGQKTGEEYILYLYDENGTTYGIMVTDGIEESYYYYLFNAQGDIIGILDSNGSQVVEYTYGAWGQIESITGTFADTIGQKNPLRYRGYYYDAETGFYYVSSRYYDPEIGRWINADSVIAGVGGSIQGYNMFAYCFNNPVNMSDSSGHWPQWIKDAANWVNNNIIQPVANFFSPSTNTISGQFQEGIIQGSGSLTGGYSEIMFRGQTNQQAIPVSKEASTTIGAFGKISGGNASGKIGVGNTNLSVSAKGVGDVLTATGQAGLTYKDGLGIKLKAKAAVATGRATLEFNVFGCQIEFGVYGDALAIGAEATIGIFEGGFETKAGASALFGGGFVLRVKPVR